MPAFHKAVPVDSISDGEGRPVTIEGRTYALYRRGDRFYALDDMCPHRGGSLGQGSLEGDYVVCPVHGWKFSLETGRQPMTDGVVTYRVKVEDGWVWIEV